MRRRARGVSPSVLPPEGLRPPLAGQWEHLRGKDDKGDGATRETGRGKVSSPPHSRGAKLRMALIVVCCLLTSGAASSGLAAGPGGDDSKRFILWRSPIGSRSGSPLVYGDWVLIGSNNNPPAIPAVRGDQGVLMCFDRASGDLRGLVAHPRLSHRANDLPGLGIFCRPAAERDRCYYVSNRGELVCLDLGSFAREKGNPTLGRVLWSLDMTGQLGVFKRDANDIGNPLSSPLLIGDMVYCVTGNGTLFGFAATAAPPGTPYVPKPDAPSFIAVNKVTGKLMWSSSAPGKALQYGQWGSPAHARLGKLDLVLFPGGDGWLYGFDARTGRQIWKVDCNDPAATPWLPQRRGTRTAFMTRPVIRDNIAYIATSVDLEITDVSRGIYAVEISHGGNATRKAIKWIYRDRDFGGTFGAIAMGEQTLYALGEEGLLVCLDPRTGRELWRKELGDAAKEFGSPVVVGGQLLAAAGSRLFLFEDSRTRVQRGHYEFREEIVGSPAVVNDLVFVATRKYLYCLRLSALSR